ncbi:MAG: hypothetical protein B7X39_09185 [Lysobacterales bacterium 14-68-21]|jgi:hypothetical protein|nr:MAG: hypothetical protein B7X45_05325 [Xanthomonadales bacterium 15-68-25]OZB66853.1 MAG: hypothetical protein B7X39_09185 [Xanthomonadales bacterium 14-68-21]
MSITIDIAKDFSDIPGGRFPRDGEFNGETFRDKWLAPALEKGEVIVILDHTEGFGSSFLEEAFGGLVRHYGFSEDFLRENLKLIANTAPAQRYKRLAETFLDDAIKVRRGQLPKGPNPRTRLG